MPGAVQARPKLNYTARRYAKEQWETIIESLRENGTLTLDTLDLAKNLVLVRVRIAMASNVLFSQGLEYYDIDLNRMRASCGAAEMDSAIRISVLLMESLGMTPKSRDKVSKVERKEQPKRASGVYLKSVS
jgi:hypothetical protein